MKKVDEEMLRIGKVIDVLESQGKYGPCAFKWYADVKVILESRKESIKAIKELRG